MNLQGLKKSGHKAQLNHYKATSTQQRQQGAVQTRPGGDKATEILVPPGNKVSEIWQPLGIQLQLAHNRDVSELTVIVNY